MEKKTKTIHKWNIFRPFVVYNENLVVSKWEMTFKVQRTESCLNCCCNVFFFRWRICVLCNILFYFGVSVWQTVDFSSSCECIHFICVLNSKMLVWGQQNIYLNYHMPALHLHHVLPTTLVYTIFNDSK